MRYLQLIFITFMILFSQCLFAQDDAHKFLRFRLLLKTGERIEGKNGVLTDTSFIGRTKSGNSLSIPRGDIRVLDRYTGTQAGKGALVGAGAGLLGALTIGLSFIAIGGSVDALIEENAFEELTLGLTAGGGLIGLLVGSAYPTWGRVPIKTAMLIKPETKGIVWMAQISF